MAAEKIGPIPIMRITTDSSPQSNSFRPLNEMDVELLTLRNLINSINNNNDPDIHFSMSPELAQQHQAKIQEISKRLGLNGDAESLISSLYAEVVEETGVESHQTGRIRSNELF